MNRDEAYIAKQVALLNHRFIHSDFYGGDEDFYDNKVCGGDEEPLGRDPAKMSYMELLTMMGGPEAYKVWPQDFQDLLEKARKKEYGDMTHEEIEIKRKEKEKEKERKEKYGDMNEQEIQAFENRKQEEERQKQRSSQKQSEKDAELAQITEYYDGLMEADKQEYEDWKAEMESRRKDVKEESDAQKEDTRKQIEEDKKMQKEAHEQLQKDIEEIYKDTQEQLQQEAALQSLKGYKPCASNNYDEDDEHKQLIDEEAEEDAEQDEQTNTGGSIHQKVRNKIFNTIKDIHSKKKIKNRLAGGKGLGKALKYGWDAFSSWVEWEMDRGRREAAERKEREEEQREYDEEMARYAQEEKEAEDEYQKYLKDLDEEYKEYDKNEADEYEREKAKFEKSLEDETEADRKEIMDFLEAKRAEHLKQRDDLRAQQQADLDNARKETEAYEQQLMKETMEETEKMRKDYQDEIDKTKAAQEDLDRRVNENVDERNRRKQEGIDTSKKLGTKNCNVDSTSDSKMRHDAIQEEKAKREKEEEEKSKNITPDNPNGSGKPRKNQVMGSGIKYIKYKQSKKALPEDVIENRREELQSLPSKELTSLFLDYNLFNGARSLQDPMEWNEEEWKDDPDLKYNPKTGIMQKAGIGITIKPTKEQKIEAILRHEFKIEGNLYNE